MIEYDDERRRIDWLIFVLLVLALCAIAFLWSAWIERSDARAAEQLASEQCRDQIALRQVGGTMIVCVQGSGRDGK